jgi:hypothetical protein
VRGWYRSRGATSAREHWGAWGCTASASTRPDWRATCLPGQRHAPLKTSPWRGVALRARLKRFACSSQRGVELSLLAARRPWSCRRCRYACTTRGPATRPTGVELDENGIENERSAVSSASPMPCTAASHARALRCFAHRAVNVPRAAAGSSSGAPACASQRCSQSFALCAAPSRHTHRCSTLRYVARPRLVRGGSAGVTQLTSDASTLLPMEARHLFEPQGKTTPAGRRKLN